VDSHRRGYSSRSSNAVASTSVAATTATTQTTLSSRSSRRYGRSSSSYTTVAHHLPKSNNDRIGGYIGGSANRRATAFNNPTPPPWHPASRLNPHTYAANPNVS
jgi:hypothetical protein